MCDHEEHDPQKPDEKPEEKDDELSFWARHISPEGIPIRAVKLSQFLTPRGWRRFIEHLHEECPSYCLGNVLTVSLPRAFHFITFCTAIILGVQRHFTSMALMFVISILLRQYAMTRAMFYTVLIHGEHQHKEMRKLKNAMMGSAKGIGSLLGMLGALGASGEISVEVMKLKDVQPEESDIDRIIRESQELARRNMRKAERERRKRGEDDGNDGGMLS